MYWEPPWGHVRLYVSVIKWGSVIYVKRMLLPCCWLSGRPDEESRWIVSFWWTDYTSEGDRRACPHHRQYEVTDKFTSWLNVTIQSCQSRCDYITTHHVLCSVKWQQMDCDFTFTLMDYWLDRWVADSSMHSFLVMQDLYRRHFFEPMAPNLRKFYK